MVLRLAIIHCLGVEYIGALLITSRTGEERLALKGEVAVAVPAVGRSEFERRDVSLERLAGSSISLSAAVGFGKSDASVGSHEDDLETGAAGGEAEGLCTQCGSAKLR